MHHNPTHFSNSLTGSIATKTITQGSASASEVQEVTLSAEAGKFTLAFNGDTTPELAFNAGNTAVQSALRALPSIGSTNVKTQREASGTTITFTVTFQGELANTDVPQIAAAEGTPPLTLAAHPQYWFDLNNVGSSASSGPIELTVELPVGLLSKKVIVGKEQVAGPRSAGAASAKRGNYCRMHDHRRLHPPPQARLPDPRSQRRSICLRRTDRHRHPGRRRSRRGR